MEPRSLDQIIKHGLGEMVFQLYVLQQQNEQLAAELTAAKEAITKAETPQGLI